VTCPKHDLAAAEHRCACTKARQRMRTEARTLLADAVEGAIAELEALDVSRVYSLRAWIKHAKALGLPYAGGGPPPEPTADGRWLRDPDSPCMYVYVPSRIKIEDEDP
jgi:hypothetical protein